MENVSADFIINNNNPIEAEYTIEPTESFDCSFELYATGAIWGQIAGELSTQTDLQDALDLKADKTELTSAVNELSGDISDLTLTVSDNYTELDGKITDNNTAITSIQNTINTYGDIVTYDATDFATSNQGALADTALQPNDNISELVNNIGYITGITSTDVTTALGYIPYSNANPNGYQANVIEAIKRNGTTLTITNKTVDISVPTTASDVGALPDTTTINDLTTPAQQNALNSGATTTNIGQIATNTSDIAIINGKIPSQASSSNQLADKNFVNSSISTNTANFKGTFNSVAELEAYSGTVTNNDYAFVVGVDGDGNTVYDRYKYTTATTPASWVFEYELNNSSFTAQQWASINSGITSSDVTLIGTALQPNDNITQLNNNAGYINTTQLQDALDEKQDLLTAGTDLEIVTVNSTATTVSGTDEITLTNAHKNSLNSVTITGKCTQSGTPSNTTPVTLTCNNGILGANSSGILTVTGTTETIVDELGNTATARNLYSFGSYADTQEIISGSVTRQLRAILLTGQETYTSAKNGNTYRYTYSLPVTAKVDGSSSRGSILSTHFTSIHSSVSQTLGGAFTYQGSRVYMIPTDQTLDTVQKFTNWVETQYNNGTPIIIIYPLETEATATVTGQTLNIQSGDNTIEITQASLTDLAISANYNTQETNTINFTNDTGYVTSTDLSAKVDKAGDTMTGNLIMSGKSIYLDGVASTVSGGTAKLYFGSPSTYYNYIGANTSGNFGIYNSAGKGVACYPAQCLYATNNIDIGRTNNKWKNVYASGKLVGANSSLAVDSIISGANKGATAIQPNDNISGLTNDVGYITGITSNDVTTALGYTPYNSTNPNGYISGISSNDVTTALGYTPVNSSSLATVATTGDYDDLLNKPTIPDAQIQSDWAQTNNANVDFIKNKPLTPYYGTSSSAADAVTKEVSIPAITELKTGQIIYVRPSETSTVANSKLKLNNFDAYNMRYANANITTSTDSIVWGATFVSGFLFDGTYWQFIGHGLDTNTNTTYSAMSVAEGIAGTATNSRTERADYLKQIIQGTTLTGLSTSTNSAVVATDSITVGIGKLQAQINNSGMTVDQTYDGTSANAQSGVAIAGAGFIQNTATGSDDAITIYGTANNQQSAINIGKGSEVSKGYSIAIGYNAKVESNYTTGCIQLGTGTIEASQATPIFSVGSSYGNYTLLNLQNGIIPDTRISSNIARTSQIPTVPTNISSFTNDSGYITGITSTDVTTALGYTPYDATNPSGYISGINSSDIITALGYTPYADTNPNGYITGINSADVENALGYTPYDANNPDGYITGITSSDVTTALGYTPYNSSNPNGYTSNVGTVTSVNNVAPVSGNVTLSIPSKISNLTDDTATYPVDKADTLTGLTATITELNYTDGVTSSIQTQLDGKATSTLSNVTAQSVANAIGYTPANLNLSNLTTTGKLIINGAVTSYNTEIFNGVSLNGSTDLEYTLSGLPNDNYTYMVLFSGAVSTGTSSGNYVRIGLYSDACPVFISLCSARTRTSSNQNGSGNCWMPVPANRKIYVSRSTSWNGSATLETKLYYRIGNGITI